MLTRLRRVSRAADAGMTLAELMVGMGLLLVVTTVTTLYFVSQNTQTNRTLNSSFTTSAGRTALATITNDLHFADTPTAEPGYSTGRFVTASATQIVFYSNVNANRSTGVDRSPPTRIDIHVSGTSLVEQDYKPITAYTTYPANYDSTYTSNYPASPSSTTTLVTKLSSTSIFTFCGQPTGSSSPSCPSYDSTDLGTIASVGVQLSVYDPTGHYAQTYQTTVTITGAFS